jgi:threonine dehydrogenase-like Zn-dependent dehydrogenase
LDARAAVQTGPRTIELRALPLPERTGPDEALLAIEANGMCGTDWEQYKGSLVRTVAFPVVPGHEIVGRVERIGERAAARWGIGPGARVAVESTVPCGRCPSCVAGRWLFCDRRVIYGLTTLSDEPALSGGYAEYLVLRPHSTVYPLPDHLTPQDAVFFNPLGSGFDWAVRIAGTTLGDTVVILGPGQRGLACFVAAREAGAGTIIVAGRSRRPWKLDLALRLGATHVVDTDHQRLADVVADITDGALADRAVDTTPLAAQPVLDAMDSVRPEGTVVLSANKSPDEIPGLVGKVIAKALTVKGAYSVSEWAKRQAIRALSSGRHDLSALHTHTVPIDELDRAMRILGGEVPGEEALHITVTPR